MRIALALLLAGAATGAAACDASLEGGQGIDGKRYRLSFRTRPAQVAVGKPFAVDLVVCPRDGEARIGEVRVDAHMPEHRHGMNYRPSVKAATGPGHYRAEGLVFHMPGRWQYLFDISDGSGHERLTRDTLLR